MKLRKDWKRRLLRNYKWLFRALIALIVLSPAFLIELLLVVLSDATDFVARMANCAKWAWRDSNRVKSAVERVSAWVASAEVRS